MLPLVRAFIAQSLDGYIARPDGGLDWLPPSDAGYDYGYDALLASVDVVVLGRSTFETVRDFDPWPYGHRAVFVLSTRLRDEDLPISLRDRVQVHPGPPRDLLALLSTQGYRSVYVDGGRTIQSFLRDQLLDELHLFLVPVLLGAGIPLFGPLPADVPLRLMEVRSWPSGMVGVRYGREEVKSEE